MASTDSTATETATKFWAVTLSHFPIQGFADSEENVSHVRPKTMHYHPPLDSKKVIIKNSTLSHVWYSEADLADFGLTPKDLGKGWLQQERHDFNVRSDNYRSMIVRAPGKDSAIRRFRQIFKIRATDGALAKFKVEPAPDSVTREQPFDIMKKRLSQEVDEPWND